MGGVGLIVRPCSPTQLEASAQSAELCMDVNVHTCKRLEKVMAERAHVSYQNSIARAFAPSIDRQNCRKGYTRENCRR